MPREQKGKGMAEILLIMAGSIFGLLMAGFAYSVVKSDWYRDWKYDKQLQRTNRRTRG